MVDHLLIWRETRVGVSWTDVRHGRGWPVSPVRARRDGIAHRIATVEHARDSARAQRMLAAYEQMRADAVADEALDFGLLAKWQCMVLGVADTPFRTGPAFAKNGRETYGFEAETSAWFGDCLAGSRDDEVPVAARAARVYLDVCFFHPFTDGNARSALLAFAFVLAKDGIVLDEVGPIAQVQRPADDPEGAVALADLAAALIEGTLRRFGQDRHYGREQ